MTQQRMISKEHDDAHYCVVIFKYARGFALMSTADSCALTINIKFPRVNQEFHYLLSHVAKG